MINKTLVEDLRQMFLDGATPSQLMHRIAMQHKDDGRLHFVIKDYFSEAFGIPLLRNVVSDKDYTPCSRHAHYNRDIAPEIVQRVGDWNKQNLEGSWLIDASVSSLNEHAERLKTTQFEELNRVWGILNEKEKLFIIRKIACKDYYWDVVKMLSLLTERLQEKIVELEGRLNGVGPEYLRRKITTHDGI